MLVLLNVDLLVRTGEGRSRGMERRSLFQLRPRLATQCREVPYEVLGRQTFHERGDPVRSPTYAAVAHRVHKEAVGRWRRYAAPIEPLEMQLAEVVRKVGVNL